MNYIRNLFSIALLFVTGGAIAQAPGGVSTKLVNGVYFEVYDAHSTDPETGMTGSVFTSGYLNGLEHVDDVILNERDNNFGMLLTTQVNILVAGDYQFRFNALDDEAALFIDGTLHHAANCCGTSISPTINLTAGYHDLEVRFSEGGGGEMFYLDWDLPGGGASFVTIPNDQLFVNANMSSWHKADAGISDANGATLTAWTDQGVSGNNLTSIVNTPVYHSASGSSLMNFNPTVEFNDDYAQVPDHANGFAWERQSRTVFTVTTAMTGTAHEIVTGYGRDVTNYNFSIRSRNRDLALDFHGNFHTTDGLDLFAAEGAKIGRGQYVNSNILGTNNVLGALNGRLDISSTTGSVQTRLNDNTDFTIGNFPDHPSNEGWNGSIAEVIYYPWQLDASEIARVESYLAIKYGISLDQNTATNYVASNGTTIWDATANAGYTNAIFGIARDDNSGLDQRISKPQVGDVLAMSLDNDFTAPNNAASRVTLHTNTSQFLILSNNNGGSSVSQRTEMPAGTYHFRMEREWRVSATNFNQNISMKFDVNTAIADYYLMKDADGDFSAGAIEVGQLNSNGEISGVSLSDGEYITIVARQKAPGGVVYAEQNGVYFEVYDAHTDQPWNGISGSKFSSGYVNRLEGLEYVVDNERSDNYTIVLKTKVNIVSAGDYLFRAVAVDDRAALFVDGSLELTGAGGGSDYTSGLVNLTAGYHDLEVRFSEVSGPANFDLIWDLPGGGTTWVTIPDAQLYVDAQIATWHKGNEGISDANGATVGGWTNQTGFSNDLTSVDGTPLFYSTTANKLLNFNSTVEFNDDKLRVPDHSNGLAWEKQSRTVFMVTESVLGNAEEIITGYGRDVTNEMFDMDSQNQDLGVNFYGGAYVTGNTQNTFADNKGDVTRVQYSNSNVVTSNNVTGAVNGQLDFTGTVGSATTRFNDNTDFVIGNRPDGATAIGFNGRIAEVVNYPWSLSATEISRVESYLAVKYGITLSQAVATNYLASDGTVAWDGTANVAYNHDIFGIARDNASDLDQRVSKSVNSDAIITLALDNDFVSPNNDGGRTTAHTNDLQFLLLSNNDGGVTVDQTTELPVGGYDARMAREWKISALNFSQQVNLKFTGYESLDGRKIHLFADADGDFAAGATSLGELDENGEITGITLNNGEFLTLVAEREGPGGIVANLQLWYKGDAGVTIDATPYLGATQIAPWKDQASGQDVYEVDNNDTPDFMDGASDATFNYNPYGSFNNGADGDVLGTSSLTGFGTNDDITAIFVVRPTQTSGYRTIMDFGNENPLIGTNGGSLALYKGSVVTGAAFNTNQSQIFGYTWNDNGSDSDLEMIKNGAITSDGSNAGISGISNTSISIGAGNHDQSNEPWLGSVAEVIVYNHRVQTAGSASATTDLLQIHSYLALKYGVSLDQSTATNYLASDATVVWNAATNTGYTNDIFGLGRDDDGGLDQRISTSTDDDDILTLALDNNFTLANNNAGRTSIHSNDKQFLILSNNDGGLLVNLTSELTGQYNFRMAREWRVSSTNFAQSVNMKFAGLAAGPEYYVIKDTDGDGDFATGTPTTIGQLDNNGEISGVTLNDGDYLTIMIREKAPGGVSIDLAAWFKGDEVSGSNGASISQWDDATSNNNHATQGSGGNQPTISDNEINFNRGISFDGSDDWMPLTNPIYASNASGTMLGVVKRSSTTGSCQLAQVGNSVTEELPSMGTVGTNVELWEDNQTPEDHEHNTASMSANTPFIMEGSWSASDAIIGYNGNRYAKGSNHVNTANLRTVSLSGYDGDEAWNGIMGEVVFYAGNKSSDIAKIQSYFAVKYGITLDPSGLDYLASDGSVIWDLGAIATYDNHIFGIGRDDISSLDQRVSKSINTGAILTIALDNNFTLANNDAGRTSTFSADTSFLIIGTDNATLNETTIDAPAIGCNPARIEREWKVDMTNFDISTHPINMQFDLSGATFGVSSPVPSTASDFMLAIDVDGDGDFSTGNIVSVDPASYAGGVLTFTNVNNLVDGAVFTIVTKSNTEEVVLYSVANSTTNCTNADWIYYKDPSDATKIIAAINMNGNAVTPADITVSVDNFVLNDANCGAADNPTQKATYLMNRLVEFDCPTCNFSANGGVQVRLFWNPSEQTNAGSNMDAYMAANGIAGTKVWQWFKVPESITEVKNNIEPTGIITAGPATTWPVPDEEGTYFSANYIQFNNITSFSTFGGAWTVNNPSVLPIELLEFNATATDESEVNVTWSTAAEINNDYFTVEKSVNGLNWEIVGTVDGAGNSDEVIDYSLLDQRPFNGVSYYRLKQTDFDGASTYSEVRAVTIKGGNGEAVLYPNPTTSAVVLEASKEELSSLRVIGLVGQDVSGSVEFIKISDGCVLIDVSNLRVGMYYVVTKSGSYILNKQ